VSDDLLVALTTTTIVHQGRSYRIERGVTVVYADDEVVQGRERLFGPLRVTRLGGRVPPAAGGAVETATAGPGERREVRLAQPEQDAGQDADPYASWTRKDLVAECKARDLPAYGSKDELIARLRAGEPDGT
jgi:hypothetical protein